MTNFQAASIAIGQPDLVTGEEGPDPTRGFAGPVGLALTPDGSLLIADPGRSRVLFFNPPGDTSGDAPAGVLGQASLQGTGPSEGQDGMNSPFGVAVGAGKFAVADRAAHRVLVYDAIPRAGAMPRPVAVIGQPDFDTSGGPSCGPAGLNRPESVAITPGGKLLVADTGNNRVLVWNNIADIPPAGTTPVPPPNIILGQSDPDHCTANDDLPQDGLEDFDPSGHSLPSARTLSSPTDVWSDDDMVIVADRDNSRVLVWQSFPRDSFEAASRVLGHSTFTDGQSNSEVDGEEPDVGPTARKLSSPSGIHFDGTILAVADSGNDRVLVWNTFPAADGQAADVVLGHATFDQSVTNDLDGDEVTDTPTAQVFNEPVRVLLTPDALLVSDRFHHRVLLFRRGSTAP